MRFCIFHNAQFYGGGERHTLGLAHALAEASHQVHIVDCGVGVYRDHAPTHANITVSFEPTLPESRNAIAVWLRLRKFPAGVAVIVSGGLNGFPLAVEAGIALRYHRVIRIDHGCTEPIESYPRRYWLGVMPGMNLMANRHRLRRFLRSAITPLAITVSHASKQALMKYCYMRGSNMNVVHNGTDCSHIASIARVSLRDRHGIPDDNIIYVYCGRLSHEKRVEVAIGAFSGCVEAGASNITLLIVGAGPLEENMKALAQEHGLSQHVVFAGFQNDPSDYYSASDCLLLPSLTESFPLTPLEAMHFGCYPIVTRVGGVPEMFATGVPHEIVEPGNADQLRDAMLRFLALPESERIAAREAVQSHVAANFDARVLYGKLVALLEGS